MLTWLDIGCVDILEREWRACMHCHRRVILRFAVQRRRRRKSEGAARLGDRRRNWRSFRRERTDRVLRF